MTIEELSAALEKAQASITKLEAKNSELIDREKAERQRADEAENATGTELEKATKRAEKAERDLKAANDRADTNAKTLREVKADHAIAKAIAEHNVDAKHVRAATAILKLDMQFSDDGEPLIDGKPVDAFAKSYFAKDGATYVRAANNSGGLATGNDGTSASDLTKAPETAEEYTKFFALTVSDKARANALADQWGRADLKA